MESQRRDGRAGDSATNVVGALADDDEDDAVAVDADADDGLSDDANDKGAVDDDADDNDDEDDSDGGFAVGLEPLPSPPTDNV